MAWIRPAIAAVSQSTNRLDIFGLGTNTSMFHKAWDGSGWRPSLTGWDSLGGTFNSPPAVMSWGAGRVDVFVLGSDNSMFQKAWTSSGWSDWVSLGGVFNSPPSVMTWGVNRQDIFAIGTDNAMYQKAWAGSGWSDWVSLGGFFISPPAVVTWAVNRQDLFGIGGDRAMYHKYWNGSAWGPPNWESLGGAFNSIPAVVAWSANRLDIFGVGTDYAMYHKYWDGSAWGPSPTGWESLGGVFNSQPVVVSWGPNRLDIFGLGTDNAMYHKAWNGSAWQPSKTGWDALGGVFNSAPAVAAWGANRLDIFGLGTDNAMYHKYWDGAGWGPSLTGWETLGGVFEVPVETRTFHFDVVTPGGTSWGGSVDLTFKSDGAYRFHFHAHSSSAISNYDFQIRAVFIFADGTTLVAQHGGHLGGIADDDFMTPNPADPKEPVDPAITKLVRDNWDDVKNGKLYVARDYSATGFGGVIEDVVKGIADVTRGVVDVSAGAAGFAAGVVIMVGYEMGHAVGDLNLDQSVGVISGVAVFATGGTLLLVVASGVAAGAVTHAAIQERPMTAAEITFAKQVFGDTIPWDRIEITNLHSFGGRAFTTPFIGGKIYVNLGEAFGDPQHYNKNQDYPVQGQLLIHELTHAWQIAHASLLPDFMCKAVVAQADFDLFGEDVYAYGPAGPAWSQFGPEQQAAIVDGWFQRGMHPQDQYFTYIRDHILTGHT